MMSVREMIGAIQREVRDTELQPDRAAELCVKLAALMGNCNDEIRLADHAYSVVLLRFLEADEAANRAKIRAETSTEYLRRQEARATKELVVELVRSMKYLVRSNQEEMRLAR